MIFDAVYPSPNFDERKSPISMIVLHYTGMETGRAALQRLTDPAATVSAHYFVDTDGTILQLVPEEKRAWHAGVSRWRDVVDVNSASIGVEIVNPGHEFGYVAYPSAQIDSVILLVHDLMGRHGIDCADVIGHSDVAPARKDDPGELFPWDRLARLRLALGRPKRLLGDPGWSDAAFLLALERFGYDVTDPCAATIAFQRRFRPEDIGGIIDGETRALLFTLLAQEEARKAA